MDWGTLLLLIQSTLFFLAMVALVLWPIVGGVIQVSKAIWSPVTQPDLGAKGVWYRLRIGPIDTAASASNLCDQLKSQGVPDCSVIRFTQSPDKTLSTSLDR